ncbi:hypothetical protein HaLaN_02565, partial [Haematococcus lacustris]
APNGPQPASATIVGTALAKLDCDSDEECLPEEVAGLVQLDAQKQQILSAALLADQAASARAAAKAAKALAQATSAASPSPAPSPAGVAATTTATHGPTAALQGSAGTASSPSTTGAAEAAAATATAPAQVTSRALQELDAVDGAVGNDISRGRGASGAVQLGIWDLKLLARIKAAMGLLTTASVLEHMMRGPHHCSIKLLTGEGEADGLWGRLGGGSEITQQQEPQAWLLAGFRWSAAIQPQPQQLAAATPAGTTLDGLHAHILDLKASWDALWEEYLKPRRRLQRTLHPAGESMQRPLELCGYEGLEALPPIGEGYQQRYKLVDDRQPNSRQRLHRAAEYQREESVISPHFEQLRARKSAPEDGRSALQISSAGSAAGKQAKKDAAAGGGLKAQLQADWVADHAMQVQRMLPGVCCTVA